MRIGRSPHLTKKFGLSKDEILKQADGFGVTPKAIEDFLTKSLVEDGVMSPFCSHANHPLAPNTPVFLFDGTGSRIETCYCSDPYCFLGSIDPQAILGKSAKPEQTLCCVTCDRMSEDWKALASCRKAGHDIRPIKHEKAGNPAPMATGKQLTHTEHAAMIMANGHFLTLRDTGEVLHFEGGTYIAGGESIIKEAAERRVENCTERMRIEIVNTIRVNTFIDRDAFDNDPMLVNIKNGIFNMETMTLTSHTHTIPFRTQLNVTYDPQAGPTRFMEFLREVVDDWKDRQTLLEMFATVVLRGAVNLEKAIMLIGEGANGKSTLLRTMIDVFGPKNVAGVSIHELIWNRFAKASLDGKMLNVYGDISSQELDRLGVIKSIITGEEIEVEKKNQPSFLMKPYAKMFFAANQLPEVKEDTDAIYRRFIIIEFKNQFKGRDKNPKLLAELTTEQVKSGIFNLLIHYAKAMLRNGHLTYEPTTEQMRAEWHDKADPTLQFFDMCIERIEGKYVKKDELYAAYVGFCSERHFISKSQRVFTTWCKEHGYLDGVVRVGTKTPRVWKDITLKSGGAGSTGSIDTDGGLGSSDDDTPSDEIQSDVMDEKTTHASTNSEEEGYRYCTSCKAGPWEVNNKNGKRVVEYHTKRGCDVRECNERGALKE